MLAHTVALVGFLHGDFPSRDQTPSLLATCIGCSASSARLPEMLHPLPRQQLLNGKSK